MSTVYLSQLAVDAFSRPNENPLASPPWSAFGGQQLQIVSSLCEGTLIGGTSLSSYTNVALPADQYASGTIANIVGGAAFLFLFVRVTGSQSSGTYYKMNVSKSGGNASIQRIVSGAGGQIYSVGGLTVANNDVWTCAVIGTTLYIIQNSIQVGSIVDTAIATGTAAALGVQTNSALTDVQVSAFAVGSASNSPGGGTGTGYSVPDCRTVTSITPNASRVVQGTVTYDVPKVDSRVTAPVDSRAQGAPVDSRQAAQIPLNSRTPGTFGPGE